jgi:hypothetical protein
MATSQRRRIPEARRHLWNDSAHPRRSPPRHRVLLSTSQRKNQIKDTKHLLCRIRRTIGGDRTNFTGAESSRTAFLEVVRILLNSVLADFIECDITVYYLGNDLNLCACIADSSHPMIAEYDLEQPYFQNDVCILL